MDTRGITKRLQEERDRLTSLRDGLLEQHGEGPEQDGMGELASFDQHDADMATETFEREKDESIRERLEGELEDVDRALGKLDAGTYGACEACGRPIGEDRLEAYPAARFCIEDLASAEAGAPPT
jgi:RNA polymerase-binding transcription factor DksA